MILPATHLAPGGGFFAPQLKCFWQLEIALDDAGDQVIIVQSLDAAGAIREFSEVVELNYAGWTQYTAGKTKYGPLEVRVKDFVDIGSANALIKWRRQVSNPETGSIGLPRNFKKNADFSMWSSDNSISRYYKLIGCWPESLDHGDFNMNESGPVLISMTMRYDRCVPGAGLNFGLSGINAGIITSAL